MNDTVAAIQRRWSEAFARTDIDALASLYAEGALFFGSLPDLYLGQGGVRRYFETLARGYEGADFGDTEAIEIAPGVLASAGFVTFTGERNGERFCLVFRMSWTLIRTGSEWQIASHHASPKNWA
jgi:ketosteroid isomerase-like protein